MSGNFDQDWKKFRLKQTKEIRKKQLSYFAISLQNSYQMLKILYIFQIFSKNPILIVSQQS